MCLRDGGQVSESAVEWCSWWLMRRSAGPGGGLRLVLALGTALLLLLQKHLVMKQLELDRVPAEEPSSVSVSSEWVQVHIYTFS